MNAVLQSINGDELQDPVTVDQVRTKAVGQQQAKLAAVRKDRTTRLARLHKAVKDKAAPTTFGAGTSKRRRGLRSGGPVEVQEEDAMDVEVQEDEQEGLKAFVEAHGTADSLKLLDMALPPLSPSPEPEATPAPPAPCAASTSEKMDVDQGSTVTSADADAEAEGDADGEADADGETEAATTAAGTRVTSPAAAAQPPAPPAMVVQPPSTANSEAEATPSAAASPKDAPTLLAPSVAAAEDSVTPTASTSALPYGATATPSPGLAPSLTPQPATISPSLLAGSQSGPSTSPSGLLNGTPYTSLFGIPEISSHYTSTLPELPTEVLRNRLNSSVRKKGKEKAMQAPPPDLYKMHIKAQHTGAKNFLGRGKRVHNVLSTHDWSVGLEELRAIRAFDKIEQLKADKAWSFRQPKKQRVGLVPKAHWDHLMDEMRWLQTDFRQERRWKIATAHHLACSVKAWHRATPDERIALCVKVVPPRILPLSTEDGAESAALASRTTSSTVNEMDVDADGSVEADGEAGREQTVDADGDGEADAEAEGDDAAAAAAAVKAGGSTPAKAAPVKSDGAATPARAAALAGPSGTPRPGTPGSRGAPSAASHAAAAMHIQNLIALRAPVFELGVESTLVDPRALSNVDDASIALSLSALFPDLPLYSDFLLASDPQMDKRIEDSSAWSGRLSHVSKLLESKPLLVSTVQPGRTRTTKGWEPSTSVFLDDSKELVDPREIVPTTTSVLFAGPKPKPKEGAAEVLVKPAEIPNPDMRAASLHWSPDEDARVLALVKQYGSNWTLIAEIFNTASTRPASDYRLGWDIYDRWDKLAGPSSRKVLPDGTEITVPPPEYVAPADKFGKPPQFANFEGSKKRLRHLTVFDAMRKVQKKREITAAKQPPPGLPRRINMSMHDSHNLPPRPLFSPMEWHAVKLEQDASKLRLRAQQQAEYQAQQQRLQQQQQAAAQAQAQQQQQHAQQQNGGVRYAQSPAQGFPAAPGQQRPGQPQQVQRPNASSSPGAGTPPLPGQFTGPNGQTMQITPEQLAYVRQQREQQMQQQQAAMAAQQAAQQQQ